MSVGLLLYLEQPVQTTSFHCTEHTPGMFNPIRSAASSLRPHRDRIWEQVTTSESPCLFLYWKLKTTECFVIARTHLHLVTQTHPTRFQLPGSLTLRGRVGPPAGLWPEAQSGAGPSPAAPSESGLRTAHGRGRSEEREQTRF